MPVTLHNETGIAVLQLEESVDIAVAAELKQILLGAAQAFAKMRIDLSQVTALDVTAVQILWAAEKHARSAGVILYAVPPKDESVMAILQQVGVDLPAWEFEPAPAVEQH